MKHVGTSKTTLYVPRGIVWSYVAQFENLNKWWSFLQFSDESVLPESGKEYEAVVNRGTNEGSFLAKVLVEELDPGNKITFHLPLPYSRYVFILEDRPPWVPGFGKLLQQHQLLDRPCFTLATLGPKFRLVTTQQTPAVNSGLKRYGYSVQKFIAGDVLDVGSITEYARMR